MAATFADRACPPVMPAGGRPLDFELRRGEIIGLAGPNGAGKVHLLLKALWGGVRVFGGEVEGAGAGDLPPGAGLRRSARVPLSGRDLLGLTGADRPACRPGWPGASTSASTACRAGSCSSCACGPASRPRRPIWCCSTSPPTTSTGPAWPIWPDWLGRAHGGQGIVLVSTTTLSSTRCTAGWWRVGAMSFELLFDPLFRVPL